MAIPWSCSSRHHAGSRPRAIVDRLRPSQGRKLLTVPADATLAGQLAPRYSNDALGDIVEHRDGGSTVFDFGEWKAAVASRKNPDGSLSFVTISPGVDGIEFVVSNGPTPALVTRDAQHEYTFRATPPSTAPPAPAPAHPSS